MITFIKKKIILFLNDNVLVPKNFFFKDKLNFADIGASSITDNYKLLDYNFLELHLFEPDLRVLDSYYPIKKNINLYDMGLWSKKTNKNLFLLKNQAASSLFKPNLSILEKFEIGTLQYKIKKIQNVKLDTLDNLKKNKIFDFIKIDAEGSDYNILLGGKKMLNSTLGVQVEIQNIERYKDSALYYRVLEFLHMNGFEMFIYNKEFWTKNKNHNISTNFQNVWSDVVFFKTDDFLASFLKNKSKNYRLLQVKKIIFLMIFYKLHDSAYSYLLTMKNKKIISNNDFLNLKKFILKNIELNIIIIFKDLIRLLFILVLFPFSLFDVKRYFRLLFNLVSKNLNNLKRFIEVMVNKKVLRNKGI